MIAHNAQTNASAQLLAITYTKHKERSLVATPRKVKLGDRVLFSLNTSRARGQLRPAFVVGIGETGTLVHLNVLVQPTDGYRAFTSNPLVVHEAYVPFGTQPGSWKWVE